MKTKNNKKCIVCGTKYTYCSNCAEFANVAIWHNLYHDENCKEIFEIAVDFNSGNLDKNIARERIEKCNLSNKKLFHKSILKAIDEICETTSDVKFEEPVVESMFVEPVVEVVTETDKFEDNYKEKKYNKKYK